MKYSKVVLVVFLSLAASWFLFFFMERPLFGFTPFDKEILNFYLNYQFSTLFLSVGFLGILYVIASPLRLQFLNIRRVDGPVAPAPWMGLRPKEGEGWKTIGLTIGSIITVVTAVVVYFQVVSSQGLRFRLLPEVPLVFLFALMNSFTEEVIFRLSYVTVVANENLSPRVSEILSALVFGGVHYFGIAPSGIPGALMAGFIGWFLAKSIQETKGFFWAWGIHFAQDVVILLFLFMRV